MINEVTVKIEDDLPFAKIDEFNQLKRLEGGQKWCTVRSEQKPF